MPRPTPSPAHHLRMRVPPPPCSALASDHGICRATAYRYLDEVIAVLAEQAPDLAEALERAKDEGFWHVILDGKVIPADRCKEPTVSVKARSSTCGTPGRRTPTAATSRRSAPRMASRGGRQDAQREDDDPATGAGAVTKGALRRVAGLVAGAG